MHKKEQRKRQLTIRHWEEYGYVDVTKINYSDIGWSELKIHRLTKAGLNFVTGSPDSQAELKRLQKLKEDGKRRIKRSTLTPDEEYAIVRNTLRRMADTKDTSKSTQKAFDAFFLESFQSGNLTLLAREPALAETVSVIPSLKASQIYTAWKLQNIEAMFRANKFLTSLDRRQIEPPRNITALESQESNGKKIDTYTFTKLVLDQWYAQNPDSYLFRNPIPGAVSEESWREIPTFYSLRDLPGFESILDEEKSRRKGKPMNSGSANSFMRHSSLGLAMGKISNYLVYHTTQKGHLWSINIEQNVIAATQRLVNIAGEAAPVTGANRTI